MQQKFDHSQSDAIVAAFKANGFVIVQGLLSDSAQLDQLRLAADLVSQQTRQQGWPYKRTVGKQFPPWNDESPDVWGVQHIMHPDLHQPAFAGLYFSPQMLALIGHLSGQAHDSSHAMVGLLNLLIEPQEHEFALDWHRDSIKSSVGEVEEQDRLRARAEYGGVQWNLALYEDECLFAVPGSHLRPRTATERALTTGKATGAGAGEVRMPNGVCVGLLAGEAVFYDAQILHRGTYKKNSKRRTLHGAHLDCRASIELAPGILQHFEKSGMFYGQADFFDQAVPMELRDRAKEMVARMVEWTEKAKLAGLDGFVQDNV